MDIEASSISIIHNYYGDAHSAYKVYNIMSTSLESSINNVNENCRNYFIGFLNEYSSDTIFFRSDFSIGAKYFEIRGFSPVFHENNWIFSIILYGDAHSADKVLILNSSESVINSDNEYCRNYFIEFLNEYSSDTIFFRSVFSIGAKYFEMRGFSAMFQESNWIFCGTIYYRDS